MATGTIKPNPTISQGTKLTGFASVDGLEDVLRSTINALSQGFFEPIYFDLGSLSSASPFYATGYSGYATKISSDRGYALVADAFGKLFLITLKDGAVTITSK